MKWDKNKNRLSDSNSDMVFVWSSIYCISSRSETLQTPADNELLV